MSGIEMKMHERYMAEALKLAREAGRCGEVPVGCVVVCEGKIISCGMNTVEKDKNALKHAEMNALEEAIKVKGQRVLRDCDMYVTLEPCPMCAGAIQNCGIKKLLFGAYDEEKGACLSKWNVTDSRTLVYGGILKDDCEKALREFFDRLRGKTRGACDE